MLRDRLLTAAVGIPVLLYLVFWAPFALFRAVVLGFTLLALLEYFSMAFPGDRRLQVPAVLGGALVALSIGAGSGASAAAFSGVLLGVMITGLVLSLFAPVEPASSIGRLGTTILGVLYAGALLPHLVWLRGEPSGAAWVFFVLAVGMAGDTAGYFAGRFLGRHLLMPSVSPKKTVEGAVGAVGGNLLGGALAKALLLPEVTWGQIVALSLAAGALAQVGDLSESLLKRAFGAKDSGWLLPGHGGILDRADSLVFPAVLVYYYVSFLHAAT